MNNLYLRGLLEEKNVHVFKCTWIWAFFGQILTKIHVHFDNFHVHFKNSKNSQINVLNITYTNTLITRPHLTYAACDSFRYSLLSLQQQFSHLTSVISSTGGPTTF